MVNGNSVAIIDPVGIKAGMDHYDLSLANGLRLAGRSACVLSNFTNSSNPDWVIRIFKFRMHAGLRSLWLLRREYAKAIQWCRQNDVGKVIVHVFHFTVAEEYLFRMIARSGLRMTAIVHDVGSFVRRSSFARVKRMIDELFENVVVHNQFTADELYSIGILKPVYVIPHGHFIAQAGKVDSKDDIRKELNVPVRKFGVLFFGMIKESKGLDILVDAFRLLPDEFHLIVAGRPRGSKEAGLLKMLQNKEWRERATVFPSYIGPESVGKWFAVADACVLPYRRIYQSGVALQAMSRKVPVIMSDILPNRQWLPDAAEALFFRSGDAEDLARKISLLKSDQQLANRMQQQAYDFVALNHDWEMIAARFDKLLQ